MGIQEVSAAGNLLSDGHHSDRNAVILKRVLPSEVASTETSVLETVLEYGTAKAAALGQFAAGKTGTTSNYGDAWFVGWDSKYTVAVWVGYPNSLVPMTTDFDGGPVLGGTFPALIWHDFMTSAMRVEKERASEAAAAKSAKTGSSDSTTATGSQEETPGSTIETTATPPPAASNPKSGSGETAKGTPATGGGSERGEAKEAPKSEATPPAPPSTPATPPATPAPEVPSNEAAPTSKPGGTGATGGVSPSG